MTTSVYEILKELNESNSSNYKLEVLKKYQDNELLKRVLSLANDKVKYNFGIGKTTLYKFTNKDRQDKMDLDTVLDFLENELATRNLTGNAAADRLEYLLSMLSENNANIIEKVISRDLKINCGRTQINKVFKDLIVKPIYMRCDVYNKKTAKNINFENGAYVQKKADGTFRTFNNSSGDVSCSSRSGEEYTYPLHFEQLSAYPNGNYIGEMTVIMHDELIPYFDEKLRKTKEKEEAESIKCVLRTYAEFKEQKKEYILPRAFSNGIVNSLSYKD